MKNTLKNGKMDHLSDSNQKTGKILKNTLMLYFREILILLVSLYTVRVVLNTLGAEDYGIYNVVAGVVTMFSFLSGAMATASQRYFSFNLGKNDSEHLKTTFSVTFQIYILIAMIVLFFAETVGLWFVNNKLVIPMERMTAANWIYQAAIISFLFTLITTPYMASIIAHEDMNIYALVSIVEAVLKLTIVFLLKIFNFDKLILYGILLMVVTIINTTLYRSFCHKKYAECKIKFVKDKALFKEIVSYSGWNLFGSCVGVANNQIMNILLNIFFGPVVNAARGIASQVNAAVNSFSQSFSTAIRPQIIKSFAAKENDECIKLVLRGCKMTFFLMWIFTLPLCLEMPFILKLWLKNIPEYTVLFTQLTLIDVLITSVSYPLMTLCQATGKIKLYQGVVGGILLMNLPICYAFLKTGSPPFSIFLVSIFVSIVALIVRIFIIKFLISFSLRQFCKNVVVPCSLVVLLSSIITFAFFMILENEIVQFFVVGFSSFVCVVSCVLFLGVSKNERKILLKKVLGEKK